MLIGVRGIGGAEQAWAGNIERQPVPRSGLTSAMYHLPLPPFMLIGVRGIC